MSALTNIAEPITAVDINDQLTRRKPALPDYLREKLAIQDLARQMSDRPAEVLPRLVDLAMEICEAQSGCGAALHSVACF